MTASTGLVAFADWVPCVAALAARATLVLLLTAVVAALLWRASAAVRHLVWCAGIVGVLALPLLSMVAPAWELPLFAAREAPAPTALERFYDPDKTEVPAFPAPAGAGEADFAASAAEAGTWLSRAVLALGVAGMAAGLLWLAAGFWGVSRLGRRAQAVRDAAWLRTARAAAGQLGLRRPVRLLRGEGSMPATGGILRPLVVIPAAADAWPEDRRHAVLAHELAHVKRYDCLTQALAQVACALLWWHPAVWYAARRLRMECERACDDLVLGAGIRPSDYAAHLLEVARAHRGVGVATPALVGMARPSQLESRLLRVLDGARSRGVPSSRTTVLAVLLALLAAGSLSALRPTVAVAAGDARGQLGAADGQGPKRKPEGRKEGKKDDAWERARDEAREREKAREKAIDRAADEAAERAVSRAAVVVGVDPDFRAEVEAGVDPHPAPSPAMDAYAAELAGQGVAGLSAAQLQELREVGVTGAYVAELRRAGVDWTSPELLVDMRAVRVSADYVRELRGAGLTGLSATGLAELRSAGVTAEFVRQARERGEGSLSPAALVELREGARERRTRGG